VLRQLLRPLAIKRALHWVAGAASLRDDLRDDLSLLSSLRRFALPLPGDDDPWDPNRQVFPDPPAPLDAGPLRGKRVGIIATGGGGAMVCAVGVVRALEEAGVEIAAISSCSGSALSLGPIAAGLDAEQTARFMLGWRRRDYVTPRWSELWKLPLALGRDLTGLVDSESLQRLFEGRLGPLKVGELPIPFYGNVWELDRNRLLYLGTRTRPELALGLLIRAAVTLPLFIRPIEIDGALCGDGGVVNIFPADPLCDLHPEIDAYVGINAFYPPGFAGEDASGWDQRTFAPLRAATQTQQCQHLEAARMQLRRVRDRCLLIEPLEYRDVKGVKLYEHFVDRRRWHEFMLRGYAATREALASGSPLGG
jgi:NTE family protein